MSHGGQSKPTPDHENLTVVALSEAKAEARAIIDEVQYAQLVQVVRRLSEFGNKAAMSDLSVRRFRDFWELRCVRMGFLKRVNIRVYFAHEGRRKEIILLKTYKKEEDRRVCPSIHETLEDRLEDYLSGKRQGISIYRKPNG